MRHRRVQRGTFAGLAVVGGRVGRRHGQDVCFIAAERRWLSSNLERARL